MYNNNNNNQHPYTYLVECISSRLAVTRQELYYLWFK